uniref:C-type lectin domain-containing protein n=1 Tax=Panagrolaimus superbus TaxID=310955 RepID=A0A914YBK7_9BILA
MLKLTIVLFFTLFKLVFCLCPAGTIASFSNPSNCYLFVTNQSAFITAEGFCRQKSGHLTSISNAFDNMFLSQEANTYFHESTNADFWIGGTNELIPGSWSWMDGTSFIYADWEKGQPQNISNSNCISSSFSTALWTAEDCFKNKTFICLISEMASFSPTPPPTTTHKPYKCDDGWTLFKANNFCYKAFSNLSITWQNAENFCINNHSANLVSIHTSEENSFIAGKVKISEL